MSSERVRAVDAPVHSWKRVAFVKAASAAGQPPSTARNVPIAEAHDEESCATAKRGVTTTVAARIKKCTDRMLRRIE